MEKSVCLKSALLTVVFLLASVAPIGAEDIVINRPYNWKLMGTFELVGEDMGPVRGTLDFQPDVTYEYIDIGGTLPTNYYQQYGPYAPYAISVRITTVNPSGYTLTCSIISGGQTRWSGELGAGQSSGTFTVYGVTTYVKITNNNDETTTYSGQITLIND
jgi:hypothetical protein